MRELTILLDADKKTPLYEQIYEYIRSEIRGGRMECGVKLPSARALAGGLQVSRSTVDLAYAKLQDEGYIAPVPCKGFFVCDVETILINTIQRKIIPPRHRFPAVQSIRTFLQRQLIQSFHITHKKTLTRHRRLLHWTVKCLRCEMKL